jgi:hypothetical protein
VFKKIFFLFLALLNISSAAMQLETISLISSDGKTFIISKKAAEFSGTIKNLINDIGASEPIPFTNISSEDLELISSHLQLIENLQQDRLGQYNLRQARTNLRPQIKKLSPQKLIDLLLIANYLDIQPLINAYAMALIMLMPEEYYIFSYGFEKKVIIEKSFLQSYFAELLKDTKKTIPTEMISYMEKMQNEIIEEVENRNKKTIELFRLLEAKKSNQNTIKMKKLIDEGININKRDKWGTPLIKSIIHNHYDIALDLISSGANVNLVSSDGRTALMKLAAGSDVKKEPCPHLEIFDALLKAKADLNIKDFSGNTALSIAVTVAHKPMIRALKQAGAR